MKRTIVTKTSVSRETMTPAEEAARVEQNTASRIASLEAQLAEAQLTMATKGLIWLILELIDLSVLPGANVPAKLIAIKNKIAELEADIAAG